MFRNDKAFRKRVSIHRTGSGLSVRIERQNLRAFYYLMLFFTVAVSVMFAKTLLTVMLRHPEKTMYVTPVLVLGLVPFVLAIVIALWGAFGVEEIAILSGTLRWTLRVLRWSRTSTMPVTEIENIRAVTPWYGIDNTVEVVTRTSRRHAGDKLLRDEATQLATALRKAVGLPS